MASYSEIRKIAREADRAGDEGKDRMVQELAGKLPERDALAGVDHETLIVTLKISRKTRLQKKIEKRMKMLE